jgi:hypothetical protein|tara:strand:+ start:142 stop:627 length:486 start_codon:yes stop_codon:yes gene_type:complete
MSGLEDLAKHTRESETHDKQARRKPWTPVKKLETPAPPEGYEYRWVRESILGKEDANNIHYRLREGWDLVMGEELPADWQLPTLGDDKGRLAGVVHNEGLILMKMPLETVNERREYFADKTRKNTQALDNTMFNDANKDGKYVKYDSKRDNQVTFGKSRSS